MSLICWMCSWCNVLPPCSWEQASRQVRTPVSHLVSLLNLLCVISCSPILLTMFVEGKSRQEGGVLKVLLPFMRFGLDFFSTWSDGVTVT